MDSSSTRGVTNFQGIYTMIYPAQTFTPRGVRRFGPYNSRVFLKSIANTSQAIAKSLKSPESRSKLQRGAVTPGISLDRLVGICDAFKRDYVLRRWYTQLTFILIATTHCEATL